MDTRTRIADAAYGLLVGKGYEGMTIEAIAREAEVAPQTVYAVFRSKAGILAELLDRTAFGPTIKNSHGMRGKTNIRQNGCDLLRA